MIYLILAIASSAMISIFMRVSERYSKNGMSMLAMNYLTCAVMAWMNVGSFDVFAGAQGAMRTVGLGIVCGVLFLAAFVLELHPVWIFFCLKSDQILKCFVAVVKVNRYKWVKKF